MKYQIFAEIDGRSVPMFHPLAADSVEAARDAALSLIQARGDVTEVRIFRGDKCLAVLDRSSEA